jgi:hypothetical protein
MMNFPNGAACVPAEMRIATDAARRDVGRELAARLRAATMEISIQPGPDGEARTVRFRGHGARGHQGLSGKQPASSEDRL